LPPLFFDGGSGIVRVLLVGGGAYVAMVVFLRVAGQRTLSKMNAFDLVVTVALGSSLASAVLDDGIALAESLTAFGLLIGLQYAVTWSSVRAPWVRRIVTGEPQLLLHRGALLPDALRRARVLPDEVRAAVRAQGRPDLDGIEAVVLETDGSFSVVTDADAAGASSLEGVRRPGGTPGARPPAAPAPEADPT
jgi:uncharacterized membrane protein YcaP (DUF421 family)